MMMTDEKKREGEEEMMGQATPQTSYAERLRDRVMHYKNKSELARRSNVARRTIYDFISGRDISERLLHDLEAALEGRYISRPMTEQRHITQSMVTSPSIDEKVKFAIALLKESSEAMHGKDERKAKMLEDIVHLLDKITHF